VSEVAAPSGPARAGGALAAMFGLAPDESEALGRLLHEVAAAKGLDARRLVTELDGGRSIGAALGLPAELGDVLYARAHRWFEAGRPERAEPLFRALCTLDGSVADHWVAHGICLRLLDRVEAAETAFVTAVRLRPDWDVPFLHLAGVLARRGHAEAAEKALDAFEARRGASTPETIVEESRRLRSILRARSSKGGSAAADGAR
jgi:Flp pilus assembly protein TadD